MISLSWMFLTNKNDSPDFNREIYALIEDNLDPDNVPFVEKLITEKGVNPELGFKLVEYDPEEQEEILQQRYTIIAWRYV